MKILITICGRGGSKGIPGKNIRLLNGIPLIAYSIKIAEAFASKYSADIALSTDDEAIMSTAGQYGLHTSYKRPAILANDAAGKIETIRHLLNFEEESRKTHYDYVLDLAICSPLRNIEDLDSAFQTLLNDENALNLFSVNQASNNPYFSMVEEQPNKYFGLVKKGKFLSRQVAPKVYDLNGSFYFYRRKYFDLPTDTVMTDSSLIYIMPHLCYDLDHVEDFEYLQYLIVNDKLGFNL
jgi:CMP-N,N'-diacetyllegionaminic acid synthase